jgi:hypothetical protein
MANTYIDYTATSNQTSFSFTFPVLLESHVVVEINGVAKQYNTDYTVNKTSGTVTLQLDGSVGVGATSGDIVRIRRVSDKATDLVDFADGSRLSATRLDLAYQHNRYLNEESAEISDGAISEITVGGVTSLDAKQRKIVNLPTPSNPQEASNKSYVDQQVALSSTNLTSFGQDNFTGDGATTVFTFSNITPAATDSKAYIVNFDGITQSPQFYTISNSPTNTITFSSAPPNGVSINVVTLAGAATLNFPATHNTSNNDVTFSEKVIAKTFRADQGVPDAGDGSEKGFTLNPDGDTGMFGEIDPNTSAGASGQIVFYSNNNKKLKINKGLSGTAATSASDIEVTTNDGTRGWIDSNVRSERVNAHTIFFYAPSADNDGTFSNASVKGYRTGLTDHLLHYGEDHIGFRVGANTFAQEGLKISRLTTQSDGTNFDVAVTAPKTRIADITDAKALTTKEFVEDHVTNSITKRAVYENTSFNANVNNVKLPLTEVSDPYNIASVSNNVITVGSGTYIIDFACQAAEDDNNSGDFFTIQLLVGSKAVDSIKVDETGSTSTYKAATLHGMCYHPTDNQTFYINLAETDSSHIYMRHCRMVITKID